MITLGKCEYFLKHKYQVFGNFKDWKTLIENQTNKKIKVLWTNNGLEFCNNLLSDYCKKI